MFLLTFHICILPLMGVYSARILGVFPVPTVSHQIVFRTLTMELAKRGHELVIITPYPSLPKDRLRDNITEIDMSYSFDFMESILHKFTFKLGAVLDSETACSFDMNKYMVDIYASQLDHPDMKKFLDDNKNKHFDLILLEAVFHVHYIFTHIFKAPAILITSFHGFPESFELVGAIGMHPIFYPNLFRQIYGGTTIIEKLREIRLEYKYKSAMQEAEEYENLILKERFGPNTPKISDLKNNIDMFFVNLNPFFQDKRPVPPSVIYVGPLHLQPVKTLPQDLQTLLHHSRNGVIYVSLGSPTRLSIMGEKIINTFLDAFKVLPYDILWKYEGDNNKLKKTSRNLKIQKWFPQREILAHRNLKLFVTQGGLQSTDEAIDSTVPMVAIPLAVDQYYNAYKIEQLGIGIKLDMLTLDTTTLVEAIEKVLTNDSYRANIKKIKSIIEDQVQTPLERAVWWTEYVIRHKGAKHLRCPAANITWAEFLMIDVVLFVLSFLLIMLMVLVFVLKYALQVYRRFKENKKVKLM